MSRRDTIQVFSDSLTDRESHPAIFSAGYEKGLEVYRNNYLFNLVGMLETTFSSINKVLDENFKFFAYQYIKDNPSLSPNIEFYGEAFPSFIQSREELKELFYLYELAVLDWTWYQHLNFPEASRLEMPVGLLKLWSQLQKDDEVGSIEIDMDTYEEVQIIEENQEYYFINTPRNKEPKL